MPRPMTSFATPILKTWTPDDVQHAPDPAHAFAEYVQQTLGVPWPTVKDMAILRKKCREFFEHYPQVDWRTLCRVVVYMRNRKRRVPRMWMVVDEFRKAYTAGQLPELDPHRRDDEAITARINEALAVEDDEIWRRRLVLAEGAVHQQEVFQQWQSARAS